MEIYVIRHTRVQVDSGVCYGQSDVLLHRDYLQHIAEVKHKFPSDFDKVFSSPLQRCTLLAAQLTSNEVIYDRRLMEMDFGLWENKTWDNIASEQLDYWMENFVTTQTPDGESLILLFQRVCAFVEQLRNQTHRRVALVTHAGVIRCIWAYLLDIPLENIFKLPVDYGHGLIFKLGSTKSLDQIIKTSF
ncbi:alpha-ribazole phosphatase [Flavobacterium sp. NKUCC04_CG]|uniref:alpha-ribazole phosphatase n=1 Tax=Flavobacterium sp. NKUCC04_CG TaxID=2842121 RepID=UPI001C5ACD66|nr:alpha-ribazole phosphatase [Flavobacterium sp. NKUCC04_CG]MBW3519936.1 alpha-ribazole phosphatase [Flavobacterium sp. NKUCC04_CG]